MPHVACKKQVWYELSYMTAAFCARHAASQKNDRCDVWILLVEYRLDTRFRLCVSTGFIYVLNLKTGVIDNACVFLQAI